MSEAENEFFDAEERFAKKFDYNFILMRQIDKVRGSASVEWVGGYWEKKQTNGVQTNSYIPDTREVYVNSVKALSVLLLPYQDEEYVNEEKTFFIERASDVEKMRLKLKNKDSLHTDVLVKKHNQRVLEYDVEHYTKVLRSLLLLMKRNNMIGSNNRRDVA